MDTLSLLKILLKWGFETQSYDMVYFIYTEFNIGIPVKFLYNLPSSSTFNSIDSFMRNSELKNISDDYLRDILSTIVRNKYKYLEEWKLYGYSKS
jgi:hypothetical protein